ncbi:DUF4166 domain-containing protein [Paracidovorax sp. MALMAid1276]|uniref:DUF4166 domain-containing protein n=1 Tax=Paracidovorax sp. MALMAid1276 TaxID=3411631 RepID=UPI003B999554
MFALFTSTAARPTATDALPARPLDLPALAGSAAWARLPRAVQRRFGVAHPDVTYHGVMELRCSRIGHVFAALARLWGGPLAHLNTTDLPATVRVSGNGRGGMVWERCFHGDRQGRSGCTVRSTKELGADGGLRERTDGGLSMSLDVLEEDGALVFRSRRYFWVLGRVRIPVPTLLTPGTCSVAHADLGGGRFRFTLSMAHPWWGETFYQCGVFTDPVADHDDTDTIIFAA